MFLLSLSAIPAKVSCRQTSFFSWELFVLNLSRSFQSSREQLAIAEFARSLLVIPKTLAVNAAQDATELVAKLRAFHNSAQTKAEHEYLKWYHTLPF